MKEMISGIKISVILLTAFLLVSCGEKNDKPDTIPLVGSQLKPVQQSAAGNIYVVASNSQNDIKRGKGFFVIEFKDIKSGEPVKVSNVKSEAVMHIDGKQTSYETSMTYSDSTGSYDVTYDFPVRGNVYIDVHFNDSLKVQFIFSVI